MNAAEELRQLAQRGVGFDMNPTMMFTTAESMYSQWHDYFTRLDQAWRERVTAAADALSTPPADDVREALESLLEKYISGTWSLDVADRILAAFEVRPHGTVTDTAPVAWALYGKVTGLLRHVTTDEDVAREESEFYVVRPLYAGEARS